MGIWIVVNISIKEINLDSSAMNITDEAIRRKEFPLAQKRECALSDTGSSDPQEPINEICCIQATHLVHKGISSGLS